MEISELINALKNNSRIKELFYLENPEELMIHIKEFKTQKPDYLTWAEFLELLFTYKNYAKKYLISQSQDHPEQTKYTIERKNQKQEYHTFKEKIRCKSLKVRKDLEKSFRDERIRKSKMTGEDYKKKRYKSASKSLRSLKEKALTVPKPFEFYNREEVKGKSIRQMKLEEMVGEKILEEENMMNHQFRANPIPKTTTMPMYEKLKRKNEARRDEIKKTSIANTKAHEKPFSFYERDKDFYVKRALASEQYIPEEIKNHEPFKATPIPWSVSTLLFDEMMNKEENEREERIKKRSKEIAGQSKLPPRMEMHEIAKKQGLLTRPKPPSESFSFQPSGIRDMPDFKKQQDIFKMQLEKHKREKQPTILQPFKFGETRQKANIRNYINAENIPEVELKERKEKQQEIASLKKPNVNPPTTQKMTALADKRRKQIDDIGDPRRMYSCSRVSLCRLYGPSPTV